MVDTISEMSSPPGSTTDQLNRRGEYDFEEYRQQLFWWLLNHGKDPEKGVGYAEATVESRGYLIDEFFRCVWEQESSYTTWVSRKHADDCDVEGPCYCPLTGVIDTLIRTYAMQLISSTGAHDSLRLGEIEAHLTSARTSTLSKRLDSSLVRSTTRFHLGWNTR